MRSLYIFFFLFVAQGLCAQQTFQRTYEIPDRITLHGGMAVAYDGGFYLLSIYPDVQENIFKFHVTRHTKKGDLLWAYDYELEGYGSSLDLDMDITVTEDRGVVFVASSVDDDLGARDLMVKIDSGGELLWSKIINSENQDAFIVPGQITIRNNYSDGALVATLNSDTSGVETNTYLTSVNPDGGADWSKLYKILDNDGVGGFSIVTAIDRCEMDSTYMIAGIVDTALTNEIYLSKVDSLGQMLWSKSYAQSFGEGINSQVFDVACANDSTTVVTGVLQEPGGNLLISYVFKVDKEGTLMWSNLIELPGSFPLTINTQVITDNNNDVIIAGRFVDAITGDLQDYMVKLDPEGSIIWSKQFPRIDSYVLDGNFGLLVGGDLRINETEYILSSIAANLNVGSIYPFVVRIDQAGNAVCEADAMATVNDSLLTFTSDTLFWSETDYGTFSDIMANGEEFIDYDLPVLSLQDTFFCPQDPVLFTIDGTVQYAERYEWSTGDTTPMITVMEDGEFILTVTIDTLACFSLCDTSVVSVLEFPEVTIAGDNSDYCETGLYALSANPSMGLAPYSYLWSTDETERSILVSDFQDYLVTITDECGNTASTTFAYSEVNIAIDTIPSLNFNKTEFCESGLYEVGILNASGISNVVWSTGETDVNSIIVPGPGSYSVTFSLCLQDYIISIDEGGFAVEVPLSAAITFSTDFYCTSGNIGLSVVASGGLAPYSYEWSAGELTDTLSTINVQEAGVYDVTISDSCSDAIVQTITVTEDELPSATQPILSFDQDTFCINGDLILSLENANEGFSNPVWSNGETGFEIQVEEVGEYSITVTNCNEEVSDVINISDEFEAGVEFPNVFTPTVQEYPRNQTFGPFVSCPILIEDYELKVFNRWGKVVFETDNWSGRWNGNFDNKRQPSQVFHYYARFTLTGGQEEILEGDVTLLR